MSSYPTQQVLELACAAQRVNNGYVKAGGEAVLDANGVYVYQKQPNKILMLVTLDPAIWTADPKDQPYPLKVTQEDRDLADAIKKHYRKLAFAAVEGINEFQTNVNAILNSTEVPTKNFGYVACLPSLHVKDVMDTNVKRASKNTEAGYLADIGTWVMDLDCEILSVIRSRNFEAFNIDATINNKQVSWMSKNELTIGPAVIVKAKVKEHSTHWKYESPVTRLNYVKAAQ